MVILLMLQIIGILLCHLVSKFWYWVLHAQDYRTATSGSTSPHSPHQPAMGCNPYWRFQYLPPAIEVQCRLFLEESQIQQRNSTFIHFARNACLRRVQSSPDRLLSLSVKGLDTVANDIPNGDDKTNTASMLDTASMPDNHNYRWRPPPGLHEPHHQHFDRIIQKRTKKSNWRIASRATARLARTTDKWGSLVVSLLDTACYISTRSCNTAPLVNTTPALQKFLVRNDRWRKGEMPMRIFIIVVTVVRCKLPHTWPLLHSLGHQSVAEVVCHRHFTSEVPLAICDFPQDSTFALQPDFKLTSLGTPDSDYDDELDFSNVPTLWCFKCEDYFIVRHNNSRCPCATR